ncbi:hypothetical protein J3F84DRAFT_385594 [Trichoderma pleuroticola]
MSIVLSLYSVLMHAISSIGTSTRAWPNAENCARRKIKSREARKARAWPFRFLIPSVTEWTPGISRLAWGCFLACFAGGAF